MPSSRPSSSALRKRVFDRDKGICAECGAKDEGWEADHIIPLIEGGHPTHKDNIRTLCKRCHLRVTKELNRRRSGRFTGHHANYLKRLEAEGLTGQNRPKTLGIRLEHDLNSNQSGSNPMKLNDAFPSNWLKASDFEEGPRTLTIESCEMEEIKNPDGKTEDKLIIRFAEEEKGLICNKTNANTIADMYGGDTDDWMGQRVTVLAMDVQFGGKMVAGIRVSTRKPGASKAIKTGSKTQPVSTSATVNDSDSDDPADTEDIPF